MWTPEAIEKRAVKMRIKITEYSKEGDFSRIWDSVTEAADFYNTATSTISACCNGKLKTCTDRIFRYYSENYPLKIEVDLDLITKKVKVFSKDKEFIQEFKNVTEAAKWILEKDSKRSLTLKSIKGILRTKLNLNKEYKGYIWEWGEHPKKSQLINQTN